MQIDSGFDSGNIERLEGDGPAFRLVIRKDHQSDFYQWFHYRLSGARGVPCVMKITNAGGAAYAEGWKGYRAVRLSDAYRVIYIVTKDGFVEAVHVEEVNKHDY